MRPPKQKQPQVKKGICRVLEHVDVDKYIDTHGTLHAPRNPPFGGKYNGGPSNCLRETNPK